MSRSAGCSKMRGLFLANTAAVVAALLLAPNPGLTQPASALLKALPTTTRASLSPLFTANAIGQTGLNGQLKGTPQGLLDGLRASLSKAGYAEQPIRTTTGAWGFSATWAPPSGTTVDGTPNGQVAVLVTQATALGPDKLNLNIRFEAVAPMASQGQSSAQPKSTEQDTPANRPSISVPRGLF